MRFTGTITVLALALSLTACGGATSDSSHGPQTSEASLNSSLLDAAGNSALNSSERVAKVRALLAKGASPDARSLRDGRSESDDATALWAGRDSAAVISLLVKSGADVNARSFHKTPLMQAAEDGNVDVARVLLTAGADPNAMSYADGQTALMLASAGNHVQVVQELLKSKANPNIQDHRGKTALIIATHNGYQDVMKSLTSSGADRSLRDANDDTAADLSPGHPTRRRPPPCPSASLSICTAIGRERVGTTARQQGVLQGCSIEDASEILRQCTSLIRH
jgi:ankyrin repeat protein